MILRAKVKQIEDMPPGLPCCERMKAQLLAWGTRMICVTTGKLKTTKCAFCEQKFMGMRVQRLRGWRIDPRCWEIEEAAQ